MDTNVYDAMRKFIHAVCEELELADDEMVMTTLGIAINFSEAGNKHEPRHDILVTQLSAIEQFINAAMKERRVSFEVFPNLFTAHIFGSTRNSLVCTEFSGLKNSDPIKLKKAGGFNE